MKGVVIKIIKNWTESLLGVELEVPLRYMYIPEVELVSDSEERNLAESEGRFIKAVIQEGTVCGSRRSIELR